MSEEKQGTATAEQGDENTTNEEVETLETLTEDQPKVDVEKAERIAHDQKKRAEKAEQEARSLQEEIVKLRANSMSGNISIDKVNDELRKLAEEHNVDEAFLTKLVSTVKTATTKEIREEMEKDYTPKIQKIEQERRYEVAEKKFEDLYTNTLKGMSEYDGIVNKDVIKSLAFNPANAKKTLAQIVEEAYGSAVQGRKSIEATHASKEPEKANLLNPTEADWDKIQSDPQSKTEWAKQAEQQIKDYL
jgi:hypothetical protein